MYSTRGVTFALLSLLTTAFAQTWTSCNPMEKSDCPVDTGLGVRNYTIDFTQSIMSSRVWNATAGSVTYGDEGAKFTVAQRGDSPTVQTNFYIFFGQVEVIMKAATGQGIVSSIVLESDDLDEVDWEWIGGNDSYAETNYFGKGNTTSYDRAIWFPVSQPQEEFHNYTTDWSAEKLDWYIDGQLVRSLPYAAANGGNNYPQTPCNVRLGIWAGGDPSNSKGVIEWAGGSVDYNKGPYTMTVKSVRISDAHNGTQYKYGDKSGSYQSIQVLDDAAPLKLDGANSESAAQSVQQKWNGLSKTNKIIIISVVAGVVALCAGIFAFCCIKQRRAGRHERLIEDAKFEKNASELLAYRAEMARTRNEKFATQAYVSPVMGNAGGSYLNQSQMQPMMANSPHVGYAQSNYARSMSSFSTGRGYQKV